MQLIAKRENSYHCFDWEFTMAVESKWLIANAVILQRVEGGMDVDALRYASKTIIDMVDQSKRPLVHHILDLRQCRTMPLNVRVMSKNLFEPFRHPHFGWSVIITDHDKVTMSVLSMALQINKIRFRFVSKPEQAVTLLQKQDAALPLMNINEVIRFCQPAIASR